MKSYQGIVTKRSGDKTVQVVVTRQWVHPKYQKTVKRTKKYLIHDPKNQIKLGDPVTFIETRPLSKRKRYIIATPQVPIGKSK